MTPNRQQVKTELTNDIAKKDKTALSHCGHRLRESNELRESMDTIVEAYGIVQWRLV